MAPDAPTFSSVPSFACSDVGKRTVTTNGELTDGGELAPPSRLPPSGTPMPPSVAESSV